MKKILIFLMLSFLPLNVFGHPGEYAQPILRPIRFEYEPMIRQKRGEIESCDLLFRGAYLDSHSENFLIIDGALSFNVAESGYPFYLLKVVLFNVVNSLNSSEDITLEPIKIDYVTISSDFENSVIKPFDAMNSPENTNAILAAFRGEEMMFGLFGTSSDWTFNLFVEGWDNDIIFEIPNFTLDPKRLLKVNDFFKCKSSLAKKEEAKLEAYLAAENK